LVNESGNDRQELEWQTFWKEVVALPAQANSEKAPKRNPCGRHRFG
jgi:hypothetical protein